MKVNFQETNKRKFFLLDPGQVFSMAFLTFLKHLSITDLIPGLFYKPLEHPLTN